MLEDRVAAPRSARVERNTKETQITVELGLDGSGVRQLDTPVPFLSHMLDALARHGLFDLAVHARGDIEIDAHHTVEDVGLTLGQAFREALGDHVFERLTDAQTADWDAFRKHVQQVYAGSELAKSWPKGLLERINATQ